MITSSFEGRLSNCKPAEDVVYLPNRDSEPQNSSGDTPRSRIQLCGKCLLRCFGSCTITSQKRISSCFAISVSVLQWQEAAAVNMSSMKHDMLN